MSTPAHSEGMKTRLIQIGNSQGIRIPKAMIAEAELENELELILKDGMLLLRAVKPPRAGWESAFLSMMDGEESAEQDALAMLSEWDAASADDEEWIW